MTARKSKGDGDKKWMQKARTSMKKRGTVGSFTAWCKKRGHSGATLACIAEGLKSRSPAIRKKAQFAKSARKKKGG